MSDDKTPLYIIGTKIHPMNYADALREIRETIEQKEYSSKVIVQSNVFTLVNSFENEPYKNAVNTSFLSLPDGMPIVWILNRRRQKKLEDRIYGPELVLRMCEQAELNGWSCFFYGGTETSLELMIKNLKIQFPKLNIAGSISPPFRDLTHEENEQNHAYINRCKPDIVWVGLGSPKQDLWMHEHREFITANILHGVGAAFDFISGNKKQSPKFFMDHGLEWFFRLITEPRRLWKRYLIGNSKFLLYLTYTFLIEHAPLFKKRVG